MIGTSKIILASGSPRRIQLLQQIGVDPDEVMPAEIDETPLTAEHPRSLAKRLAAAKAAIARQRYGEAKAKTDNAFVLGADTVVSVGRRILPKTEYLNEAINCLKLLSGRSHRVYTAVCLLTPNGKERTRLSETRVRFKRLSGHEMESYLASGEWQGKAGGYAIQGKAGAFVIRLVGSYSAVVGLPVDDVAGLLAGEGVAVHNTWVAGWLTALAAKPLPCPVCNHPVLVVAHKPFCSERCQNVDLYRWLTGGYAVPAEDEPEDGSDNDELSKEHE